MNWRIYRLPGSREIWHIDSGPDTLIFNVRGFHAGASHSVDIGGNNSPRAWIEVRNCELHIVNDVAIFARICHLETIRPSVAASEGDSHPCVAAQE